MDSINVVRLHLKMSLDRYDSILFYQIIRLKQIYIVNVMVVPHHLLNLRRLK